MKSKRIWKPQIIAVIMLLWALYPENPYGYYILLRWVICAIFAYLAVKAADIQKQDWVWVLGIIAAIYNPIIRVHLNRGLWSVINVLTIIIALISIRIIKVPLSENQIDIK
jgi:hypothetical protein